MITKRCDSGATFRRDRQSGHRTDALLEVQRLRSPSTHRPVSRDAPLAIFLSTFVMISQNRSGERRQVLADHQWRFVQTEEQQNEELLRLSNQILELTKAVHAFTVQARASSTPHPSSESRSDT